MSYFALTINCLAGANVILVYAARPFGLCYTNESCTSLETPLVESQKTLSAGFVPCSFGETARPTKT